MTPSKAVYFLIELLTCYGAIYYSYFFFFYMKIRFGFCGQDNLLCAALYGFVYLFAAWQGGKFAQRFGSRRSVCIGFIGVAGSMIAGLVLHSAICQVIILAAWTVSVCFIWPALEAIVSEGDGVNLSDMVGFYNITWAFSGAVAYFSGGMLLERLGLQSLFWLPLSLVAVQLLLMPLAASLAKKEKSVAPSAAAAGVPASAPPSCSRQFLHLAWLANPLAYVAINTTIPLIPTLSVHLGLSTGAAGIFCSIWMFARLAAFIVLWRWTWWHYRFRFLAAAFVVMVAGFAGIVLAPSLGMLLAAQVFFGLSVGLIYYSSLYYSMHVSDQRGTHGGLHEAMIGTGLFLGPACGAFFLFLLPGTANAGVVSVGGMLVAGFSGLLVMRSAQRAQRKHQL
jgi:predicted MFS family arabinose efflux permease